MSSFIVRFSSILSRNPASNRSVLTALQKRPSSYFNSEFEEDVKKDVKFEVTKLPQDWKYVERLLPLQCVPEPTIRQTYTSEWRPQGKVSSDQPYFIERTKNHMLPVFLTLSHHMTKRTTKITKIKGDIWALETDLKNFLKTESKKPIRSQVNEYVGYIRINGDYVNAVKYWLVKNNF